MIEIGSQTWGAIGAILGAIMILSGSYSGNVYVCLGGISLAGYVAAKYFL